MLFPIGTAYNAQQESQWHPVTIDSGEANKTFKFSMCNGSSSETFGIRAVGSSDNNESLQSTDEWKYQEVLLNGAKQIEVYTTNTVNTQFFQSSKVD